MTSALTNHADGRQTRELVCTVCSTAKPFGVCCPACGDHRLKCDYTRYRAAPVAAVRVRRCRHCGHRIRTVETVVSNRA
jgi:DNA-directed RNA polymerase subunit M/transcription elongation factor TFIIS